MLKIQKRALSLTISVLILLSALFGCSRQEPESGDKALFAAERTPYIIGASVLFIGLVCTVLMLFRKRSEGLRLEKLVEERTKELLEQRQQFLEMAEAAQEANRAKTLFLANMSHEIRTPMNAVIGMLKLMEYEKLNDRQRGYVKDMNTSAYSLLEVVNDILDMSKIEAGKHELNPVDYSLHKLKDNIASVFTFIAYRKGLEFKINLSDDVPDCLFGDDIRLRQVLVNICGNAVKYTETGYIIITISASGGRLFFRIEDTGVGIRKEDIPILFNMFAQVKLSENRKVIGTGLGLPISKAFIELMGGEITVESEYGHGSVFTVNIPLIRGNAANIRSDDDDEEKPQLSAPDAKILVTDDNEFNLKVSSGLLGLMDIEADCADSGMKAIKMIRENDYDIVFMDHMMPIMDGIETVSEIRKMGGKYESLTIVALTANAIKNVQEMFLENGFNDYLSKPIDTDALREIVKKYLPQEKIRMESDRADHQERKAREEKLSRKTIKAFVKENEKTIESLTASLDSDDIATAHRMVHTLKSSAGYLGKTELQAAALSLEASLQAQPARYTRDQIDTLRFELDKALDDFRPLLIEEEKNKPIASEIDSSELSAILDEIKPLLKKGDLSALNYVEKLRGVAGMEELAERIDDYDFEGALSLMD